MIIVFKIIITYTVNLLGIEHDYQASNSIFIKLFNVFQENIDNILDNEYYYQYGL